MEPRTLVAFDLDGTLVDEHFVSKRPGAYLDPIVLPGVRDRVAELAVPGRSFAICTNQGGVALGRQTLGEVGTRIGLSLAQIDYFFGLPFSVHVATSHPTVPGDLAEMWRRKPGPGMLDEAMVVAGVPASRTIYVGDLVTDRQAAEAAGVSFLSAKEWRRDGLALDLLTQVS